MSNTNLDLKEDLISNKKNKINEIYLIHILIMLICFVLLVMSLLLITVYELKYNKSGIIVKDNYNYKFYKK